jgi:hypothetical protein
MPRRPRSSLPLAALFGLALGLGSAPGTARAQLVVKRAGQVTFQVDTAEARPGGVAVVRLLSRRPLSGQAVLDGRRVPFYLSRGVPRALVPISVRAVPGPNTLGVEIFSRRGRQRFPVPVSLGVRAFPSRTVVVPEEKRALLSRPGLARDGRELLAVLRGGSLDEPGPLAPPITIVPGVGFGGNQLWVGGAALESLSDALWGEHHRGLDYEVPLGTAVMAPGAGTVRFAGPLALTGTTLVLDHGQGVVSVLAYLSRLDVRLGERVEARAVIGLSGDGGASPSPQVHWRVYVHGMAVDPMAVVAALAR